MIVFLFKQRTAYEMRISDWSSDVCASDLGWSMTIRQSRPEQSSGNDSGPSRGGRDYARLRYKYLIQFISIASTFNDLRWVAFKSVAPSDGIASFFPPPPSPVPAAYKDPTQIISPSQHTVNGRLFVGG